MNLTRKGKANTLKELRELRNQAIHMKSQGLECKTFIEEEASLILRKYLVGLGEMNVVTQYNKVLSVVREDTL